MDIPGVRPRNSSTVSAPRAAFSAFSSSFASTHSLSGS